MPLEDRNIDAVDSAGVCPYDARCIMLVEENVPKRYGSDAGEGARVKEFTTEYQMRTYTAAQRKPFF